MSVQLNPYLGFKDNARQAMEFYKTVFGGKLTTATFKDFHASQNPSEDNLTMHAELHGDNGITFFASDTPDRVGYKPGDNFSMSLSGDAASEAELRRYFDKLAVGGKVLEPLQKAQWGDTFGMLTDKFGVRWLVNIAGPKA